MEVRENLTLSSVAEKRCPLTGPGQIFCTAKIRQGNQGEGGNYVKMCEVLKMNARQAWTAPKEAAGLRLRVRRKKYVPRAVKINYARRG